MRQGKLWEIFGQAWATVVATKKVFLRRFSKLIKAVFSVWSTCPVKFNIMELFLISRPRATFYLDEPLKYRSDTVRSYFL